ncbi:MAG TPA: sulfatase-like hydrolase/transferase [Nocardioides sp.]|nr:sulfatase-like hydrolase/transferase [Nocardioides sp.]
MSTSHRRRADISTRWLLRVLVAILLVAVAGVVIVLASPEQHTPGAPGAHPSVPAPPASISPSPAVAGKKHNIVMIVTDDMRTDELAYLPHVQQLLVDRGVWFTKAISPHPLCCPARAELTTGEYAQNNGVHHNEGPYGGFPSLIDPNDNLGLWLQGAGYYTAFVGKYLNSYVGQERISGWDMWKPAVRHVYTYDAVRYYHGPLIHGYVASTTTRFTNRAIRAGHRSGRPFYVVSNYLAPHDTVWGSTISLPVPAPKYAHACDSLQPGFLQNPAFLKATVNGLPAGMSSPVLATDHYVAESRTRICALRSVDDGVAKIVRTLERTGELADTDIVFLSDNGFNLGEHQLNGKNWITDESLDVPIVVTGPDFPSGVESQVPVNLVDIPATYLQIAGAYAGRPQDGLSLLDLLHASKPLRDTMLVQTGDDVDDTTPGFAFRGVTTTRYLYAVNPSDPSSGLLFDRRVDPDGLTNVFTDPRYLEVRTALQARLDILSTCSGSNCNQVFGPLPQPRP